MLNLQHALFCNDVSAHTHIYTHIILYKASIWILNVLFLITPLRIILLFTAPPKIIVHCAHYIESPYELCCILAHELLCVSRTFLKAPPQRMMLYFLLCLYTPLYSMHFVQTRHKNDCASHKNRPALLLCTLVPILFFAIYKQIKKSSKTPLFMEIEMKFYSPSRKKLPLPDPRPSPHNPPGFSSLILSVNIAGIIIYIVYHIYNLISSNALTPIYSQTQHTSTWSCSGASRWWNELAICGFLYVVCCCVIYTVAFRFCG